MSSHTGVELAFALARRGVPVPTALPSRADLEVIHADHDGETWTNEQARACEYLNARRELLGRRQAAYEAEDARAVERIDAEQAALDGAYVASEQEVEVEA